MCTWDWEASTGQIVWSESREQVHGLPPDGLDGTIESFRGVIHPDDRMAVESAIRESIGRRAELEIEFRHVRPGDRVHWMSARGKVFFDEAGCPTRVIGVGMDITDRKRSEERVAALQRDLESRIRELETLQDLLPVGVAIAEDPLCRSIRATAPSWSCSACRPGANVSVTAEDGRPLNWRICRDGRELGVGELPLQKSAALGIAVRDEECDLVFDDGRLVHLLVSANPLRDEEGGLKGCVGVLIDITERRRNERVSQFLAEASANLAALSDPTNTLRGVARLALPFFADLCLIDLLEDDQAVRRLAACHVSSAGEALAARLGTGDPQALDHRLLIHRVLQSGKAEIVPRVSEELLPQLAPDAEGEPIIRGLGPRSLICVPLVVRDRTFGAMTFILSESSRAYGQTDLAIAEDLARRTAIAAENAQSLPGAQGRRPPQGRVPGDAGSRAPQPNGPDLERGAPPEPFPQRSRPGRQRALRDARAPGRDHEPPGGGPDGRHPDQPWENRASQGNGRPPLGRRPVGGRRSSPDRGSRPQVDRPAPAGFPHAHGRPHETGTDPLQPAEQRRQVHRPGRHDHPGSRARQRRGRDPDPRFRRGDRAGDAAEDLRALHAGRRARRDRAQGGLGIGLSLVRSLVELHGGSISARSDGPGRGSEFVVRLPVVDPAPAPAPASKRRVRRPETQKPAPRRVLVVDDNIDAALSLAKVLRLLYGQEVQTAHDGPSAIELAEAFRPEIVLLDIGLPEMSGHEVAQALRKTPWCEACLLVAVTGWGQDADRERSHAAGFDLHLVKPVSADTILDLLTGKLLPARSR